MAEIGPGLKKKFTGIVQFDINDVGTWTLDLKTGDGGVVTEGKGKGKPDLVIKVGDADFASLYDGKSNAQQAFMKGKLQVFLATDCSSDCQCIHQRAFDPIPLQSQIIGQGEHEPRDEVQHGTSRSSFARAPHTVDWLG